MISNNSFLHYSDSKKMKIFVDYFLNWHEISKLNFI